MNLNLEEVLLHRTNAGDLVLIRDGGWQVGCTMIDHEDLFLGSLDNRFLLREVKKYRYEKQDWTTKNVMVIDIF